MELQTKHRLKLLNAKCQYVCILEDISKRRKYGEDIGSCCMDNLFLAAKLINRLECYCFNEKPLVEESISAQYLLTVPSINLSNGYSLAVIVDGEQIAYKALTSTVNSLLAFEKFLDELEIEYDLSSNRFLVTYDCSSASVDFVIGKDSNPPTIIKGEVEVEGLCATYECHNCIEQSDLSKMYATLDSLLG